MVCTGAQLLDATLYATWVGRGRETLAAETSGDKDSAQASGPRLIDRIRNSAGMLKVGDDSDGAITGMISLTDVCYIVKERAIYSLKMADQIDPARENIAIPNSVQLVFSEGSESE